MILTVSWELGQSSEFFPGGSPAMEGLTLKVYDFCVFLLFLLEVYDFLCVFIDW